MTHRILVTGAAGAVGRAAARALKARGHFVRSMDLQEAPNVDENVVGTIRDAALVAQAVRGVDAIVHLAATPDVADFLTELLPNNIVGLYHIMEAARAEGVKRIVLASSIQINGGARHRPPSSIKPIPPTEAWPTNTYAVTKLFAEDLGKMYHLAYGMSVVCARIGYLPRDFQSAMNFVNRPHLQNIFLSHDDAGRFFVGAVEADGVGYAILWAMSRPPGEPHFDLAPSREAIGYEPVDRFPQGLPWEFPAAS